MNFNNIEYNRLQFLIDYPETIPEESGIYYWVYWPDIENKKLSLKEIKSVLLEFTNKNLLSSEILSGKYKFKATIHEQFYKENGNLFGLSDTKQSALLDYVKIKKNLDFFCIIFKEVCFARPFYIGKANDLRKRLVEQHFKGKTDILSEINSNKLNYSNVWVGFKNIPNSADEGINTIIEEIFSRRLKPALTKKPN